MRASALPVLQSSIASVWSTLIFFCSLTISEVRVPNTLSPDETTNVWPLVTTAPLLKTAPAAETTPSALPPPP